MGSRGVKPIVVSAVDSQFVERCSEGGPPGKFGADRTQIGVVLLLTEMVGDAVSGLAAPVGHQSLELVRRGLLCHATVKNTRGTCPAPRSVARRPEGEAGGDKRSRQKLSHAAHPFRGAITITWLSGENGG